jgi:2-polyprenyl-3-methyl-5-hydroxy-6-metoxy-1,4-benzoquinol methylase
VTDSEADAWNEGAATWVDLIRAGDAPMHAHDRSVRELLPTPAGLTLDVGCGEGRLTRDLAHAGYDVIGFDASSALVEEARAAHPDGRYEVARADALPVDQAAAALVVCVNVLMHVVDLRGAAAELARVLEPGGVLVVGLMHPVAEAGTYDEQRDELRLSRYFEREPHQIPLGHVNVEHQHRTIEEYVRTLVGAGFVLDDLREVPGRTGAFPRYLDLRVTRR